jgi:hypothetical protein
MIQDLVVGMEVGEVAVIGSRRAVAGSQQSVDLDSAEVVRVIGWVRVDDGDLRALLKESRLEVRIKPHQPGIPCVIEIVQELCPDVPPRVAVWAVIERHEKRTPSPEAAAISRCQRCASSPSLLNE